MVIASYLSVAFVVGAVGAYHLLRDRQNQAARVMFSMALWMAVIVAPIQLFVGDAHGLNTLEHQPAKIAALEGDFDPIPGTPLILWGWPNMETAHTDYALEVPHLGALILTHDWNGTVPGLKQFPRADWPYSPVVFWAFRVMVGLGMLMIAVGVWGLVMRLKGRLYDTPLLHRTMIAMAPSGFIAVLAGWTVTEVGRQPFTIYGVLRTADSVSPIGAPAVATSLAAFAIVYFIVFGAGLVFLLRLMRHPPSVGESGPSPSVPVRSAGLTPGPALTELPGAAE
jgi:cytochrome d ubiquinol oxidase subunit I